MNGEPLRSRVNLCEGVRHHFPNIIAVDFYSRGELMAIVDELNGIGVASGDEIAAAS